MNVRRMLIFSAVVAMLAAQSPGAWPGYAQDGAATDSQEQAARDELSQDAVSSARGSPEGIRVHGHWLIEIYNPDGTLVERREVENALQTPGQLILSQLLSRQNTLGRWRIGISGAASSVDPCDPSVGDGTCYIVEPDEPTSPAYFFKNLVVTNPSSTVVLSGTATAQQNGEVYQVSTTIAYCAPTETPNSHCLADPFTTTLLFTATTLPTRVPFATGQSINVTVTISFS